MQSHTPPPDFPPGALAAIAQLKRDTKGCAHLRRSPRIAYTLRARVLGLTPPETTMVVYGYDASEGGLGVIACAPLPMGGEVKVTLTAPDGHETHVDGFIVRRRRVGDWWDLGICFHRAHPEFRAPAAGGAPAPLPAPAPPARGGAAA